MYVHCNTIYNSKDLKPTKMPISDRDWTKKMWHIYTMEYYTVIKRMSSYPCRDMYESGERHSQQTDRRTENEIPRILTHRWVMNNENTWTQGGEHYTLGTIEGNRGRTAGGGEFGEVSGKR